VDFLSTGLLVLNSDHGLSTLTAGSNEIQPLPGIDIFLSVSPDRRLLAYIEEYGSDSLEVRSLDGQQHWSIVYREHWGSFAYWLDAERVVIDYWRGSKEETDWSNHIGVAIVNIYTGQITELDATALEFLRMPYPIYDPTLTRVVYHRSTPMEFESLVLWDMQAGQELWRLEIGEQLWYIQPNWAPDGKNFAVGGPPEIYADVFELFTVTRDGQATQVTHFGEAGLEEATVYQPQWSPDGRYIAFWFDDSLAIYDVATETVTDYCIPAKNIEGFIYWSPDSRQLAANSGVVLDNGPTRTIVVDILENKAVEVAKEYSVLGWMVVEP
jgi:hypothetical protein